MKSQKLVLDWGYLKRSLLLFGIGSTIELSVLGAMYYGQHLETEHQQQVKQNLEEVQQEYEQTMQIRSTMEEFYADYNSLIADGIIGSGSRLRWLELAETIAQEQKIPKISTTLQAQEVVPAMTLPELTVALYRTPMRLNLNAFHEGDVLTFIATLRQRSNDLHWLKSCKLQRNSQATTVEQIRAEGLVTADCEVHWFNIIPAKELQSINKGNEDEM